MHVQWILGVLRGGIVGPLRPADRQWRPPFNTSSSRRPRVGKKPTFECLLTFLSSGAGQQLSMSCPHNPTGIRKQIPRNELQLDPANRHSVVPFHV